MAKVNNVSWDTEARHKRRGPAFNEQFDIFDERVWECREQVNTEWLSGQRARQGNFLTNTSLDMVEAPRQP